MLLMGVSMMEEEQGGYSDDENKDEYLACLC